MIRPTRLPPVAGDRPALAATRWWLVYDGQCRMCAALASHAKRLDRDDVLELLPHSSEPVRTRLDWIPESVLQEAVHLIAPDGRAWAGAAGVERLTALLPALQPTTRLFGAPFARKLANRLYRWVARNRGHLGCGRHCG
jgi:predicted DCC family thiol-disulfide oxidoreductase YuxK